MLTLLTVLTSLVVAAPGVTPLPEALSVSSTRREPLLDAAPAPDAAVSASTTTHRIGAARQPVNPYGQTDYSAYTLEAGEVRIGLGSIAVGVLPRMQIGTAPLLDAAGIYNAQLKATPLRIGPLDVGVRADVGWLPLGGFQGWTVGTGATASVRLAKPVGLHLGFGWRTATARGIPTRLPPLVAAFWKVDLDSLATQARQVLVDSPGAPLISGRIVDLNAAIDWQLNGRDSLVLRLGAMLHGDVSGTVAFQPDAFGGVFGDDLSLTDGRNWGPFTTWNATLSWQFAWRNMDLRVGGGYSTVPMVWALQANDIAWRFGGPTRRAEARAARDSRRSRQVAASAPAP